MKYTAAQSHKRNGLCLWGTGPAVLALWLGSNTPAVATTAAAGAPAGPRAALVIGNAAYTAVGVLKNPVNDAQDMCRELGSLGFRTHCYYDVQTRVRMRALIQDFVESLTPNTVSFIYYAGHAVQVNGENYLIPTGAQLRAEDSLAAESVSMTYIMRNLRQTPDFLNVVILDACRNNPLAASDTRAVQGLAPITDVPDATMVLYATAADELALDGQGRNGIMTKYMLANIRSPGTIDDLFKEVSLGVQNDTRALGHPQKPALYTNFGSQYCLVRCTDVELLQKDRAVQEQRIQELQARVDAGDHGALRELNEAKTVNDKLLERIRKMNEEAKNAQLKQKDREDKSFVPPAF